MDGFMNKNNNKEDKDLSPDESRRRFLKSAGKLAVYTPPAMMVMMRPSHASFAWSGGTVSWQYIHDSYKELTPEERDSVSSSWRNQINWLRSLFD